MAKRQISLRDLSAIQDDEEFVQKLEDRFDLWKKKPVENYMKMLYQRADAIEMGRQSLRERARHLLDSLR